MAYFLRLIPTWAWFVVGCLLGGVPQLAFADYNAYGYFKGFEYSDGATNVGQRDGDQYQTTPGVAWQTELANRGAAYCGKFSMTFYPSYPRCTAGGATSYPRIQNIGEMLVCPYGGTADVAQRKCINVPACESPNVRDSVTGQCLPPPEPCAANAGKWHSSGYGWRESKPWGPEWLSGTGEIPTHACADGCTVTLTFTDAVRMPISNTWGGSAYSQATGQSCQATTPAPAVPTTGPTDPKTSPEYDCAKSGQGWGTYNGTVICTGPTTEKETTKTDTTKTTNPDNTTSETQTTTQCQGATCTETKTTTNCDASGNNCTTSTTTTEKTGTGEGGEGEGDDPESKWGGNCAGGFACSGDAIQCAISKEIHEQKCRQDTRDTESNTYLNQIAPTKDIAQAKVDEALNANGEFDFDVVEKWTEAQDSYLSFTASCLPDLYFDLKGQRYTFDVGFICGIGDFVRLMMHLMAYMVLFRLLSKGFGG